MHVYFNSKYGKLQQEIMVQHIFIMIASTEFTNNNIVAALIAGYGQVSHMK